MSRLFWLCLVCLPLAWAHCQPTPAPKEQGPEPTADRAADGSSPEPLIDEPPPATACAKDVVGDFQKLPTQGAPLAAHEGQVFQGDAEFQYALHPKNQFGVQNHFQGVKRWGRYLYVSGGDLKIQKAHVLIVEMGSRPVRGAWGSNLGSGAPPASDKIVQKLDLTRKNHWHAGGLDLSLGVLAVPLENNHSSAGARGSTLLFLDLTKPTAPAPLPFDISHDEVAYALAFTRLSPQGKFLLARWNDKKLLFYTSKTSDIRQGFDESPVTWKVEQLKVAPQVEEVGHKGMHGQAINLVTQCDGKLFAVMNENTNRLPTTQGTHYLELYTVAFPQGDTQQAPDIEKIGSRRFECPERICNFTAAGGIHIGANGRLLFYSVPLFRDFENKRLQVVEFAPKD